METILGINVRNDRNINYADLIINGIKTLETRNTTSLNSYLNKKIGLICTGNFKAYAIGEIVLFDPFIVDYKKFDELREFHKVPKNSWFDIKDGQFKILYNINVIEVYKKPIAVNTFGIIARTYQK